VYFIEAGSGHIYRLADGGAEERVSGITFAETTTGDISPDGRFAVVLSGYGNTQTGSLLTLGTSSAATPSVFTLEGNVGQSYITNNNELLYTVRTATGVTLRSRTLNGGSTKTLFSVPFRSALVSWSDDPRGPHYIYPKPSYLLEGYLYRYFGGTLTRLPIEGYGLVAWGSGEMLGFSRTENDSYVSFIHDTKSRSDTLLPFLLLPEKCSAGLTAESLWCASPTTISGFGFPDSWYRGDENLSDTLVYFESNDEFQSISYLLEPSVVAGRAIDVSALKAGAEAGRVLFTNKIDNSLWLYDRP
jgi:hypothetical protein